MTSLIKSIQRSKQMLKSNPILLCAVRKHWNKDYKPGTYPKTEAERIAAAKKYGIPVTEYKPYKEDGFGYGDYPELPMISYESKDPYYPYDNPELKRNFNEPLHVDFEIIREDRYDVSAKLRYPMWIYWAQFLGTMLGFYLLYDLCEKVKMFPAVVPRQYPKEGKKHYTFEPN